MDGVQQATTLYRLYDRNDVLLYVGISGKWFLRMGQHAAGKGWWDDVATVKRETLPSRAEALAAEAHAIAEEKPLHNVRGGAAAEPKARAVRQRPRKVRKQRVAVTAETEIVEEAVERFAQAHREAATVVGTLDDSDQAFATASELEARLLALHNDQMTKLKAREAVRVRNEHGLSLAELAWRLGRSKALAAIYVRLAIAREDS